MNEVALQPQLIDAWHPTGIATGGISVIVQSSFKSASEKFSQEERYEQIISFNFRQNTQEIPYAKNVSIVRQ